MEDLNNGLNIDVHDAVIKLLTAYYPLWVNETPLDIIQRVRIGENGNYNINIECYRGIVTLGTFRKKIETNHLINEFSELVKNKQPEFLGYIETPLFCLQIQDVLVLLFCWLQRIDDLIKNRFSFEQSLEVISNELNSFFKLKRVKQRIVSLIGGLKLPDEVSEVKILDGFILKKLSPDEFEEYASYNPLYPHPYNILTRQVTVAAISERDITIQLSPLPIEKTTPNDFQNIHENRMEVLLQALHLLKPGRISVVVNQFETLPPILPYLGKGGTMSSVIRNHSEIGFQLSEQDKQEFIELYTLLYSGSSEKIRIACGRLLDAEHRFSTADALLDTAIGLEVLFNPLDNAEISFRAALNYSITGEDKSRRERFEQYKSIQKIRNSIVHGGVKFDSKKQEEINKQAEIAKNCLRESIMKILKDKTFSTIDKADASFWINLLFEKL